ncbi:LysR family transcriptional regulator [Streptomyces odontomachi]|uniref:LysR family transcriptional regulator n=1 Tax=Streptomyces odontomachi TaxID=2944940 RepID=UPI0021094020|nr:LysR family transcriptional regulator [Streptomyces sp. ODS25]
MELRQLRYFVAVAEELHFGRAAERFHIVQSAVSQQIRRLEREFGVELFDRSARQVRLTAAGTRLLPRARDMLAAEIMVRAAVEDVTGPPPARLRLGTSVGLGERLEILLEALSRSDPRLLVELVSAPMRERLGDVASGRLDAAFVRCAEAGIPQLRSIPVWRDRLLVALPAHHELSTASEIHLADLATLPLRLTPRRNHPALVDLVISACHAAGFQPVLGPPSGPFTETLAAIGAGTPMWTVAYAAQARQLRSDRVVFRPVADAALEIPTFLAVRRGGITAAVDSLMEACAEAAGGDALQVSAAGIHHDR